MHSLILIIHVALAIGVIGLVLIQHGKGADAGAAFGSGASSTVFGSRGSASFLTKMTTLLATLFFVTSLVLFYLAANRDRGTGSVTDSLPAAVQEDTPEVPGIDESTGDLPAAPSAEESDLPSVEGEGTN
ncbi:MAG: preprotein translocase subunit SecG [Gammaproteobacteria bacterium]|nr:preprotein translocase subunit SecG [Gammaproteobacteria bacterium]